MNYHRALSFSLFIVFFYSSVSLNYVVIKHNNNKIKHGSGHICILKSERKNNNNNHECSKDQNHLG